MRGKKNIQAKIQELTDQINQLEDRKEHLEDKLAKFDKKRRKKRYRKKLINDPVFRMNKQNADRMWKQILEGTDEIVEFAGLETILRQ